MSRFQIDYSNLIIRRADIQDLNKAIKNAVIYSLAFLAPSILIVPIVSLYGIEAWIVVVAFLPFIIFGLYAVIYNLGRLLGFLPKQPINIHTWVAIYMNENIGWADINTQNNYSVLEVLRINRNFRRRRVGTILVQTLAEQEIKPLYVQPERHVVSFYEKLGFTQVNYRDLPPLLKERNSLFTSKYMILR